MNRLVVFKVTVYNFVRLRDSMSPEEIENLKGDTICECRSRIADGDYIPGDPDSAVRLISNVISKIETYEDDDDSCQFLRHYRTGSYFELRIEREDSTIVDSLKINFNEDEVAHFHSVVDFVNRNLYYI